MTNDDFLFWEKAFLAAMQGVLANPDGGEINWSHFTKGVDAALAAWREKRAEFFVTVERVVTNG